MKKYKTKQLVNKTLIAISLLAMSGIQVVYGTNFSDPTTHIRLLKILNSHNETNNKMDDFNSEIGRVNGMLGSVDDENVITRYGTTITGLISQTSSISSDSNWALMSLTEDPKNIDNWRNLAWTYESIDHQLFPKVEDGEDVTYEEIDRIQLNRHNALSESTKSSMALAETRQASVKDTQKAVVEISKRSAKASSLHEDLSTGNQALMVIASESVKQTEIQAKMLELLVANIMTVNQDWRPPNKKAVDKVAEARKEREYQKRSKASIARLKRATTGRP